MVSTNRKYARIQHFGGVIHRMARSMLRAQKRSKTGAFKKGFEKKGHGHTTGAYDIDIPARPFMVVTADGVEKLRNKVKEWLAKAVSGS